MEPFPPIFAYVIFGILWFLQVIFTLTVILIPANEVLAIIEDILLVFWLILRFGPGKTFSKFSNFRQNKGFIKRFLLQVIGDLIPIVDFFPWNIWFIYKEHQEEIKEFRNKEKGITDESTQESSGGFLKKVALGAAIVATGGAAAAVAGESIVAGEAVGAAEIAGGAESGVAANVGRGSGNNLISSAGKSVKQKSKMTIQEEIGGVKTGLNREDYDSQIKNYGDFDTYIKENKEKEEEKQKQEEEKKKNVEAKRIQGIKVEKDLREEMLDRSQRRFGEDSDQVKKLESEQGEDYKDKYKESL